MRFLFLGNGNITNALLGILGGLGERDKWDITVVDILDGISGEDWLRQHHEEYDAVVNLTDAEVMPILELCCEYSLAYIDAGFDSPADGEEYFAAYCRMLDTPANAPHLFGFGMNPGLVELIPILFAPKRPYIACEIDTDLAEADGPECPTVFGTWSPSTFADELLFSSSYLLCGEKRYVPVSYRDRFLIPMTLEGRTERYCVVPHEELYGLLTGDEFCRGSIFLYRGPKAYQDYLIANRDKTLSELGCVPTVHRLKGTESVGILFYDGSDDLRYVRNRSDHAQAFRFCGHNATCFQTACGIYVAMNLLEIVPQSCSYCFTDAAKLYRSEMCCILKKLDFGFEVIDHCVDRREFERNILPLFGGHLPEFRPSDDHSDDGGSCFDA